MRMSEIKNNYSHLKSLNDEMLLIHTHELVKEERELSTLILHHLMEVERRRLYAARGFSSLFEYCVKSLGYSESAAQRRISGMRLIREIPEVETKIKEGKLSLSVISQAQTFFRQERKIEKPLEVAAKREVLLALEGMSSREVERELAVRSMESKTLLRKKY